MPDDRYAALQTPLKPEIVPPGEALLKSSIDSRTISAVTACLLVSIQNDLAST